MTTNSEINEETGKSTTPLPSSNTTVSSKRGRPRNKQAVEETEKIFPTTEENQAATEGIVESLSTYVPEETMTKRLTPPDVNAVCEKLAKNKDISIPTATRATAELIRKGAANANAKDTMAIYVRCQETNIATEVTRYDITMALFSVTRHKAIRKLAEAMAPMMLKSNLAIIKRVPTADLRGDLANKINRRIMTKAQSTPQGEIPPDPLTREEEVCCCTYAQWLPNLNELANSKRLKALLDEDLMSRKPRKSKVKKQAQKASPLQKKSSQQGRKEQKSHNN